MPVEASPSAADSKRSCKEVDIDRSLVHLVQLLRDSGNRVIVDASAHQLEVLSDAVDQRRYILRRGQPAVRELTHGDVDLV